MVRHLLAAVLIIAAAAPAVAQQRVGSVRTSPFGAGSSRLYNADGSFVGTVRDSAFVPGMARVYNSTGDYTGLELRDNAFDDDTVDVYDDAVGDE